MVNQSRGFVEVGLGVTVAVAIIGFVIVSGVVGSVSTTTGAIGGGAGAGVVAAERVMMNFSADLVTLVAGME